MNIITHRVNVTTVTRENGQDVPGTFEVTLTIDMHKLGLKLARKAASNRSRRAALAYGLVQAKAKRIS